MLKKIGLPVIALLGVLAMAPHQANAAVHFGVYVGAPACGPVVVAPAPVVVYHPFERHDFHRGWYRR